MGSWAFRHYLFGATFISLTDCSGLKTFFENTEHASHVVQRWKAELLQFGMEIEHRSARMMVECDMISRYNAITDEWRRKAVEEEAEAKAAELLKESKDSPTVTTTAGMAAVEASTEPPPTMARLSTLTPLCYSGSILDPTIGD